MRIVFVVDCLDGLGGGVASARRLIAALRSRHEVRVVTTGPARPGHDPVPGFVLPLRAMRAQGFVFGWPVRATLDRAVRGADLVHVQFPFLLGFGARAAARRAGVPVVGAFHVQPENLLRNVGITSPRAAAALGRWWVRRFYDRTDLVVCPSAFAEAILRRQGLTVPAAVISNGAPPGWGRATPRRLPPAGAPVLLLSVGRLSAEKRQDVVLAAVAGSRHRQRLRLVFAGGGPLAERLRSEAARLGLAVEIGYVPAAELRARYDEATLLVHASEVELEGMAVVEALVLGLPALVADAPASASAALAAAPAFLFPAGDAAALAARLDAILDDPAGYEAASARCLARAPAYALDACVRQLETVYARVARAAFADVTVCP